MHTLLYGKKTFKKHYGRPIICLLYLEPVFILILIALLWIQGLFASGQMTIGMTFCGFLIVMELMIGYPLTVCFYIAKKNKARHQRQWIDNGVLYIDFLLEKGLNPVAYVHHTQQYVIHDISKIEETRRYLIIYGDIILHDTVNGNLHTKQLNKFRLPRTFTNENEIYRLIKN